jgi:hypothetical protein
MLDPCNSFLDSEPEDFVVLQADAGQPGVDDLIDGDLDVTGTLFASLLTDFSNPCSTNTITDMSSSSDSESNDIFNYLSKTQENLMKKEIVAQEKLMNKETVTQESVKRNTRSCSNSVLKENSKSDSVKQSLYSRPPLMCSTTVNSKSCKVKFDFQSRKDGSSDRSEKSMNKNAIIARENREKKKQYVKQLEIDIEDVKLQNVDLQLKLETKSKQCASMQKEIQYLRNVLANQTGISALLKNIHETQGLSFSSSLGRKVENKSSDTLKRRLDENDNYDNSSKSKGIYVRATGSHKKSKQDTVQPVSEEYSLPLTPSPSPKVAGGVCLHVNNNKVSLELCSKCAENASNVWNEAGDHTYFKN